MEWIFDEYDKSFACLTSANGSVRFKIGRSLRVAEMYEVKLCCIMGHSCRYDEIKLCYSKEEAMTFVEDLIKEIKTME